MQIEPFEKRDYTKPWEPEHRSGDLAEMAKRQKHAEDMKAKTAPKEPSKK